MTEKQYLFVEKNYSNALGGALNEVQEILKEQCHGTPFEAKSFESLTSQTTLISQEVKQIIEQAKEAFETKVQKSTDAGVKTIIQMLHRNEKAEDMIIGEESVISNKRLLSALQEKQSEWTRKLQALTEKREKENKPATQKEQYLQWRTELVEKFLNRVNEIKTHQNYRLEELNQYKNIGTDMENYLEGKAETELNRSEKLTLKNIYEKFVLDLRPTNTNILHLNSIAKSNPGLVVGMKSVIDTKTAQLNENWDAFRETKEKLTLHKKKIPLNKNTQRLEMVQPEVLPEQKTLIEEVPPLIEKKEECNKEQGLLITMLAETKKSLTALALPENMTSLDTNIPIAEGIIKKAKSISFNALFKKTETLLRYAIGSASVNNSFLLEKNNSYRNALDLKLIEINKNIETLATDRKAIIPVTQEEILVVEKKNEDAKVIQFTPKQKTQSTLAEFAHVATK